MNQLGPLKLAIIYPVTWDPMMSTVANTHIILDDEGVAWIDDTNVKVIEVASEKNAHGSSPEEIDDQHRGHLSLAQIHAALAAYYDLGMKQCVVRRFNGSVRHEVTAKRIICTVFFNSFRGGWGRWRLTHFNGKYLRKCR